MRRQMVTTMYNYKYNFGCQHLYPYVRRTNGKITHFSMRADVSYFPCITHSGGGEGEFPCKSDAGGRWKIRI